ncbi:hypothetical protein [Flavobacterium sp. UBA4197]|uniref:hypothetical protein n=1 Tax=Flavobacterium sp. UBA4197 TaxID=1946546 RepID=UPI002580B485|nr:hypothetical protein [Flavobacterium sp. UBA4197]
MQAETAYNVIQALPQEELQRLFAMLHVTPEKKPEKKRKKKLSAVQEAGWTFENVTERLLVHFKVK